MKRYVIDSVSDIQAFFSDIHERTQKAFSPEDDLADVRFENGAAVFSKAEVAYFDDIILDCFVYCNDHHMDLHEIVEGLQQVSAIALRQPPFKAVPNKAFLASRQHA
jgi:hypothetical protein